MDSGRFKRQLEEIREPRPVWQAFLRGCGIGALIGIKFGLFLGIAAGAPLYRYLPADPILAFLFQTLFGTLTSVLILASFCGGLFAFLAFMRHGPDARPNHEDD